MKQDKKLEDCCLPFSTSYLVPELQSFEDGKIETKNTDMKHAIFVMSHTLNIYSLDS